MKNAEFFRCSATTATLTGFPSPTFTAKKTTRFIFTAQRKVTKSMPSKITIRQASAFTIQATEKEGEWALNINSVIVFGKIRLVTDPDLTHKICTKLTQKFTDDQAYLEKELANALPRVQCLELEIEHMTGKLVNES